MSPVASHRSPELIVALDKDTLEDAERFVNILYPTVKLFKIGSQLFTAYGPEAVKKIGEKGARVFLDLKFKDIKKTVYSAVTSGTGLTCTFVSHMTEGGNEDIKNAVQYPVFMMTVHTGDAEKEMLQEAVKGASDKAKKLRIEKPLIVGVTVLTDVSKIEDTVNEVLKRARIAKEAGLDGVVCSVWEAEAIRENFGEDFIIVTPGIRPTGTDSGDQKRFATPAEAKKAGANFIVVGRPVLEAKDPLKLVQGILQEISGE